MELSFKENFYYVSVFVNGYGNRSLLFDVTAPTFFLKQASSGTTENEESLYESQSIVGPISLTF